MTFWVLGYSDQKSFSVAIWRIGNTENYFLATKNITSSLSADLPPAAYYLDVSTTWSDGRAVSFVFEVVVRQS